MLDRASDKLGMITLASGERFPAMKGSHRSGGPDEVAAFVSIRLGISAVERERGQCAAMERVQDAQTCR